MKYYELRRNVEFKEVGCFSQINDFIVPVYEEERDNYQTLNRRNWPDIMPRLDIFKLDKKAKLTDVLSSTFTQEPNGIVVNEKVKEIIERNIIELTKVYPIEVYSANEKVKYDYFFFYVLESPDIVDFRQSEYYHTNHGSNKFFEQIDLTSVDDFYKAYDNVEGIVSPKKVKLNKTPDLFRLPWGVNCLISEGLKNQLEEAKVTGIDIKPSKIEFFVE